MAGSSDEGEVLQDVRARTAKSLALQSKAVNSKAKPVASSAAFRADSSSADEAPGASLLQRYRQKQQEQAQVLPSLIYSHLPFSSSSK